MSDDRFPHSTAAVFFDGYASPAIYFVSTVPAAFITGVSPLSAVSASTLTITGGNFLAIGPCEVHYVISFFSPPIVASRCNVASTTSVEFTLAASPPASAARFVTFQVFFLPTGKVFAAAVNHLIQKPHGIMNTGTRPEPCSPKCITASSAAHFFTRQICVASAGHEFLLQHHRISYVCPTLRFS